MGNMMPRILWASSLCVLVLTWVLTVRADNPPLPHPPYETPSAHSYEDLCFLLMVAERAGVVDEYFSQGEKREAHWPPCMNLHFLTPELQNKTLRELSYLFGDLARNSHYLVKQPIIDWMIDHYHIEMSEAVEPEPTAYPTLSAFFTRALKKSARTIAPGLNVIVSPVDGTVSEAGSLDDDTMIQAKGKTFSVADLLQDQVMADLFGGGHYMTQYLSPGFYHRVHMPVTGRLLKTVYVPGDLMSVSPECVASINQLYIRNERLVSFFATEHRVMAVVMVGAFNVGGIETVWGGKSNDNAQKIVVTDYRNKPQIVLEKGQEMGRFNLGSTVITLLSEPAVWSGSPGDFFPMGRHLGSFLKSGNTNELTETRDITELIR